MQVQADPARTTDLDLRHYLRVIGRRRWVIVAVALLFGLLAMGNALTKDDRYRAGAELLLLAPTGAAAEAQGLSEESDRVIANEVAIFGSREMQDSVAERLGDGFPGVDASAEGDNDVIVLTSESEDPTAARDSVNAYARAYEQLRRQRTIAALRIDLTEAQQGQSAKQAQLNELLAPLSELDAQLAALPLGRERDLVQAQRDQLEDNITATRESILGEIAAFQQDAAEIRRAMQNPSGGVDILNPASTPTEPFYPQPKKDLLVGLVVGLLIGLAVAFVWEQLDDAVRGRADVDRATGNLPILGVIPKIARSSRDGALALVTRADPRSSAAEAYRSLATSLEFLSTGASGQVVLFTSPGASEGKTTTVCNVGMAFAEAGHRTVVVDADLRRPRLHQVFEADAGVGLANVLAGRLDVATAVQTVDEGRELHLLPAGPLPPNPAELLRSETTETAMTKLRDAYDVVIVDCPPVLPVSDALVLSRHADLTVLLAAADGTSRRKLARAVEALRQVDAPLQGVVLNGVDSSEGYEYGYYGEDDSGTKKRRGRKNRRLARS